MSHTTAVVVIGGLPPDRRLAGLLPTPQVVIAADSGLHHAIDLGLRVTCVVGDMDSVDPAVLVGAEVNGVEVLRSPHDRTPRTPNSPSPRHSPAAPPTSRS